MAKISVYYDYIECKLSPMILVIEFGPNKIDWSKKFMFIPVTAPFKRKLAEDFADEIMGLTITLPELTMNSDKEGYFGIDLTRIQDRINKMRGKGEFPYQLQDIKQFIIQICDIEDVLAMDANELYSWR